MKAYTSSQFIARTAAARNLGVLLRLRRSLVSKGKATFSPAFFDRTGAPEVFYKRVADYRAFKAAQAATAKPPAVPVQLDAQKLAVVAGALALFAGKVRGFLYDNRDKADSFAEMRAQLADAESLLRDFSAARAELIFPPTTLPRCERHAWQGIAGDVCPGCKVEGKYIGSDVRRDPREAY